MKVKASFALGLSPKVRLKEYRDSIKNSYDVVQPRELTKKNTLLASFVAVIKLLLSCY